MDKDLILKYDRPSPRTRGDRKKSVDGHPLRRRKGHNYLKDINTRNARRRANRAISKEIGE